MRSLSLKLTLAFVFVGLTVAVLVVLLVRWQTRQSFDRFVLDSYQERLLAELSDYYATYGSWDNISAVQIIGRPLRHMERPVFQSVALADASGIVVAGGDFHDPGDRLTRRELNAAVPVRVDGERVGWVLFPTPPRTTAIGDNTPEAAFLRGVNRAVLFGAAGGTVLALLLGFVLARTISQPVRELTVATQLVAAGQLGHQVPVQSEDELSELAHSFNKMSNELARARQTRQQMTADIAHDLRTPISVILGYAEGLNDGHLQGKPETYRILYQEARHLNRLIDDLRLLSLADTGELPLNPERTDPGELVRRIALGFEAHAAEKGVALHVVVTPDLPELYVDAERIYQVLANLTGNALRHTETGGEVVLAAHPGPPGQINLQVSDTGEGIAPDDLPLIFNRFYRGDAARQASGESGLGLAIARSITLAHGGTIDVQSRLGEGATFTVTLPVAPGNLNQLQNSS